MEGLASISHIRQGSPPRLFPNRMALRWKPKYVSFSSTQQPYCDHYPAVSERGRMGVELGSYDEAALRIFKWTASLGDPHPPILLIWCFLVHIMVLSVSHSMGEVMERLQLAEVTEEERDFLVI